MGHEQKSAKTFDSYLSSNGGIFWDARYIYYFEGVGSRYRSYLLSP